MTRILFVDDDPIVLRALDRGLRLYKPRWQTRFATGGAGALELLAAEPFEIIVSDISMPVMDGVTLLDKVRTSHPHVARLALSGEFARRNEARAAVAVHQWLAKPCSMLELCATLERLVWARTLVEDPQLAGVVVGELASLPSPPALHARVSAALERSAAMSEIVALIEPDPAVTCKLLQLVNSSFFSFGARVTSLQRAVTLIGADCLRHLLLAAEVFRAGAAPPGLAQRSRLVAAIARELAPRNLTDDAYLAGLVHDIGRLAVAGMASPPAPSPVLHARLAGLLLGTWGLPAEIVTAVAFHRDPESSPQPADPTLRVVALAAALASAPPGEPAPEVDAAAAALARDPAACREIAARVHDLIAGEADR